MSDILLGTPNDPLEIQKGHEAYLVNNKGDIHFDNRGRLILVSDADKLRQSVGKILLTEQGQSGVDPAYGTTLNSFIGKPYTVEPTYSLIKQTILDAMGYHVNQYSDSTNQNEKIATVETLSVMVEGDSPGRIRINITIANEAAQLITVGILI